MLLSMHRLSPESYLHVDGKRRKQKRRQKSRSLQPSHRNLIYFRREGGDYPVNLNLRNYIHCKHSHSKPSISINLTRIAAEDRSISEDESSLKVVKQPEQAYLKWSAAFWSKGDIRLAEAMCIEVDGKKSGTTGNWGSINCLAYNFITWTSWFLSCLPACIISSGSSKVSC